MYPYRDHGTDRPNLGHSWFVEIRAAWPIYTISYRQMSEIAGAIVAIHQFRRKCGETNRSDDIFRGTEPSATWIPRDVKLSAYIHAVLHTTNCILHNAFFLSVRASHFANKYTQKFSTAICCRLPFSVSFYCFCRFGFCFGCILYIFHIHFFFHFSLT